MDGFYVTHALSRAESHACVPACVHRGLQTNMAAHYGDEWNDGQKKCELFHKHAR